MTLIRLIAMAVFAVLASSAVAAAVDTEFVSNEQGLRNDSKLALHRKQGKDIKNTHKGALIADAEGRRGQAHKRQLGKTRHSKRVSR